MATQYAGSASITITLNSLAAAAARCSTALATTDTRNVNDYRITVNVLLGAGTIGASKAVYVWIATANDDSAAIWDGNATGTNVAITLDSPNQFYLGCVIPFSAASVTRKGSFSLKAACGGSLPRSWAIIVENQTNIAFDTTGNSALYQEEYNT